MQLTQKQESLIAQYLRDFGRRLDANLPDKVRERNLTQMQARIYRDLQGLRTPSIRDEDVIAVLRRAAADSRSQPGLPLAKSTAPAPATVEGPAEAPEFDHVAHPIWLGVCAFNADRLGLEPWVLRLGAFVLGLVTGPVALMAYLAAFSEYYFALDKKDRPRIDFLALIFRTVGPLVTLILLRWGSGKLESLIAYAHERFVHAPLPPIGDWDWLQYYEPMCFYLALLTAVPFGALGGLPIANAWGHSLKRLSQALVALYGVLLCFGIASVLVGVILDRVSAYLQ